MNGGFAWKRTQLDYKNTPVNAPIIILALRLYQVEANERYLTTKPTDTRMDEKNIWYSRTHNS